MFEELFRDPITIFKYQTEPLSNQRLSYLLHLEECGFSRRALKDTAIEQLRLVHLLDLKEDRRVSASQVEAALTAWSRPGEHRYHRTVSPCRHTRKRCLRKALRWLRFIDRLEERELPRHPHIAAVSTFAEWMQRERGLSEVTIRSHCIAANEFFEWLATISIPLSAVHISHVDQAIAAKALRRNYSRRTMRAYGERLRAFFRFAEDQGWCRAGMANGIRPARLYQDETVPSGLSRKDIDRLLVTTEGDRPVDIRDRAILMLLIAYGLRSGEVSGLQLSNINWEEETILVSRSKSSQTHLYPLSRSVGQAILRYILEVRPRRQERTLFFTHSAPFRPLCTATMGQIVRRRLALLGIVTGRRGPHALRHAAAQHLLDQGMSMKLIGDYLGHRRQSSTAIYAKVDLNALREVASFDLGGVA